MHPESILLKYPTYLAIRSRLIHTSLIRCKHPRGNLNRTQIIMEESLTRILKKSLDAVSPSRMIRDNLLVNGRSIEILRTGQAFACDGKNVRVIAFGKAVLGMVRAVQDILGDMLTSGIAIVPKGIQKDLAEHNRQDLLPLPSPKIMVCEGAYRNIPDQDCLTASEKVRDLLLDVSHDDILLTLTSGGGSSLLCLPVPLLSLSDIAYITRALSKAGASISELNTVRKHLEIMKGGGLAALAYPAKVINLILSDVVDDKLEIIASGPTVEDFSTEADALTIIDRYITNDQDVAAVKSALVNQSKKTYFQTLHAAKRFCSENTHNIIVGSNRLALDAAFTQCKEEGCIPVVLTSRLTGESSMIGYYLVEMSKRILSGCRNPSELLQNFPDLANNGHLLVESVEECFATKKPICILLGGETTVQVKGTGNGGRNLELCLSAAIHLAESKILPHTVVIASIGTDGQDGPTDAAGAMVTSADGLSSEILDPKKYILNNDSYTYFSLLNGGKCLIKTGFTGTNVMDIILVLINPFAC